MLLNSRSKIDGYLAQFGDFWLSSSLVLLQYEIGSDEIRDCTSRTRASSLTGRKTKEVNLYISWIFFKIQGGLVSGVRRFIGSIMKRIIWVTRERNLLEHLLDTGCSNISLQYKFLNKRNSIAFLMIIYLYIRILATLSIIDENVLRKRTNSGCWR